MNVMKATITDEKMQIEKKFLDFFEVYNYTRCIYSSNYPNSIHLDAGQSHVNPIGVSNKYSTRNGGHDYHDICVKHIERDCRLTRLQILCKKVNMDQICEFS